MSSPHHAFSEPLLLGLLDLATHITLFGNLQPTSSIPRSPTPNKGPWAPIPMGFDLELCNTDSAVKGFMKQRSCARGSAGAFCLPVQYR